jgi:hypothetical protein
MIYPPTICHTHSTNGSKVTPSYRKLHKIFGLPPYCCFTFCKNITPPIVTYFYKVYYQDLKVNGASVTHVTPVRHVVNTRYSTREITALLCSTVE